MEILWTNHKLGAIGLGAATGAIMGAVGSWGGMASRTGFLGRGAGAQIKRGAMAGAGMGGADAFFKNALDENDCTNRSLLSSVFGGAIGGAVGAFGGATGRRLAGNYNRRNTYSHLPPSLGRGLSYEGYAPLNLQAVDDVAGAMTGGAFSIYSAW